MKYNPFRPNSIVPTGAFVGRTDEIRTIEQCLFQTKNGNAQHFLIQGERGIGKSSLFLIMAAIAAGRVDPIFSNARFGFLTISIDIGSAQTQLDIIKALGRGLKTSVFGVEELKKKAKQFWEWLSGWEVLGVRYHKEVENEDIEELTDVLVRKLVDLCENRDLDLDGILFLIDEADRPSQDAKLGEFVKLFIERIGRFNCGKVILGMAGLPGIISKLRDSHPSSPRLFETMLLGPLEKDERKQIVNVALKAAEKSNGFITAITAEALDLISELSEGYPHFVQQFGYSAFSEDSDNVIDVTDVSRGAHKENGALSQLGDKYFTEMYHAKISSNDYRRVLDTMAKYSDGWVSRKTLIEQTGVKNSTINNALNTLKLKNIILVDESRQGYYRLPTKSFAAWINAIKSVSENKSDDADLLPFVTG